MTLPVLVINRTKDADRLKVFSESAQAHGIDPVRIDAHDAHRPDFPFALYDDLIREHFWGQPDIKPGAVGCFLSHRKAWQYLLDAGLPAALICEDDIVFTEGPVRLQQAASPDPEFDVLFANDRLAGWAAHGATDERTPLADALRSVAKAGGPKAAGLRAAPGADCYLVTREGAEKLLRGTAELGIVCGVDWAMLWLGLASVDDEICAAFHELAILKAHCALRAQPLRITILSSPATRLTKGPSVIRHADVRPISALRNREFHLAHAETVARIDLGPVSLSFAGRSGPDPVMEAHRSGVLWDEAGLRLLLERLPERATIVDVGAHVGNHAVALAKLANAGRVLAVEPNAEIHKLLHANLSMNQVRDRVEVAEAGLALGMADGEGWMLMNRRRSSETMVKTSLDDARRQGAKKVRLITGDAFLRGASGSGGPDAVRIDALKIDTSGSEIEVLRGFAGTLRNHRPFVLIDHGEQQIDRIARLAGQHGLTVLSTAPSSRAKKSTSLLGPLTR